MPSKGTSTAAGRNSPALRNEEATKQEDVNVAEAAGKQITPASLETDLALVEMGAYDDDLDNGAAQVDRPSTADEAQAVFDHFVTVFDRFYMRRDFAREQLVQRKLLPLPV